METRHNAASSVDPDELIPWIRDLFGSASSAVIAGAGEADCAVLDIKGAAFLVASTDYLNSNPIVLELGIGDYYDVGRLLVASNVADVLASGAAPAALLLSVMLPREAEFVAFERLMRGVRSMADDCGMVVVGGDTKLGRSLAVCATALGFATDRRQLTPTFGAQTGDDIWLSGCVGSVAAAVQCLLRERRGDMQEWAECAIKNPVLPLKAAAGLRNLLCANGATDISDGLGTDLTKLATLSGRGARIVANLIPVADEVKHVAELLGRPPWVFPFATGGDFQYAVTTPAAVRERIEQLGFVRIGEITSEPDVILLLPDGRAIPLPAVGHRDARNLTFADEIEILMSAVQNNAAK
jgi:thiamine-monophosphate kinase